MEVGGQKEDHLTLTANVASELTGTIIIEAVEINLELIHINNGVLVLMSNRLSAKLTCSRCLTPITSHFSDQTEVEYINKGDLDDDQHPISHTLTIDLDQQIIDTLVPAIPQIPLCKPDCMDLCLVCAVNLNENPDHYRKFPGHQQAKTLDNPPKMG